MLRASSVLGILVLSLGLLGCTTTRKQARTYVDEGTQSVNHVSSAVYALARSQATAEGQAVIDPYESSFDAFRPGQRARFEQLRIELEEEKRQRKEILTAIASIAVSAAPGGSSATQIIQALGRHINNTGQLGVTRAEAVGTELVGQIASQQSTSQDARGVLATEISTVTTAVTQLANTQTVQAEREEIVREMEEQTRQMDSDRQEQLRQELLARIDTSTQEQKAAFAQEYKSELVKIGTEVGWTQDEINKIDQMDADEVFKTYGVGGAGGAIGIFALLRTFGKSRSKEEVDAIRKEVFEMVKATPTGPN